jgi:C4-dicarboxylate-specific signal transduction histidine kinase
MFDRLFKLFRKLLASADNDRVDSKFDRLDVKVDHLDVRIDNLERSQAAQTEKLSAIHQVSLANNEALEQKLNRNTVTTDSVRQIVDARMESFQANLKNIQSLIERIISRDY